MTCVTRQASQEGDKCSQQAGRPFPLYQVCYRPTPTPKKQTRFLSHQAQDSGNEN